MTTTTKPRSIPRLVADLDSLAKEFDCRVTEMMQNFARDGNPSTAVPEEVSQATVTDLKASLRRVIDAGEHLAELIRTREIWCALDGRDQVDLLLAHARRARVMNVPPLDPSADARIARRHSRNHTPTHR